MKKTIYLLLLIAFFALCFFIAYHGDRVEGVILGTTLAAIVLLLISFRSTAFSKFDFDSMPKGSKTLYLISFTLLLLGLFLITAPDMLWLKIAGAVVAFASAYVVLHISSRNVKTKHLD